MTPFLTIFTTPKPFTNPHVAVIQRNALRNWTALGPDVQVLAIGEEAGLAEAAQELGVAYVPQVQRNAQGTPLVSDIFRQARKHSESPYLAYVNADMLLLSDFIQATRVMSRLAPNFLVVGQRWDVEMVQADGLTQELAFEAGWEQSLIELLKQRGQLHPPAGSDYFIFPRSGFNNMPDFAIGRAGWDNWMIYAARKQGWPVVDATVAVQVLHQNHDYSHLPGGQPHYRLPETHENVRLSGGRKTIFTLQDVNYTLTGDQLQPIPLRGGKWLRELETWPLRKLQGRAGLVLGEVHFILFNPVKAWRKLRGWVKYVFRKRTPGGASPLEDKKGKDGYA